MQGKTGQFHTWGKFVILEYYALQSKLCEVYTILNIVYVITPSYRLTCLSLSFMSLIYIIHVHVDILCNLMVSLTVMRGKQMPARVKAQEGTVLSRYGCRILWSSQKKPRLTAIPRSEAT